MRCFVVGSVNKETMVSFLTPLTEDIRIKCRLPDGRIVDFKRIQYQFDKQADEAIVVLESEA